MVSWGERILEWPLPPREPELREVVAPVKGLGYSNGGCALDVDGDGVEEIIVARGGGRWCADPKLYWFQETAAGRWSEHLAVEMGRGSIAPHDLVPISFGTGRDQARGVVAVLDRRQLEWYQIPADPAAPWLRHPIATLPKANQSGLKVGDVAGHGRSDLVCGTFWVECPADPLEEPWVVHRYSHWEDEGWGGMDKVELADMDGDGQPEIVATEAEIPNARVGIFYRDPKLPEGEWNYRELDRGLYCPHSLVLTDIDGDGAVDIIVGEMTAGGWSFPLNDRPRILAYLNRRKQPFEKHVLVEGWGVHEMGLVPRHGSEPLMLFAADETQTQKFADMKTRVHFWMLRPKL